MSEPIDADNSQIIATEGDTRFLVAPQGAVGSDTEVQVIDIGRSLISRPRRLLTVLNNGEWELYSGEQSALADLIKQVDAIRTDVSTP